MLIDRSRIDTRLLCRRKRFWQYDYLGKGITKIVPPGHKDIGQYLHTGAEQLVLGNTTDAAVKLAIQGVDDWQIRYLVEGMLRGWAATRLPQILDQFTILETETQHNVDYGWGIEIPLRRDVLARRKYDNLLVLLDYKTLGYYVDSWDLMLENSLQTFIYIHATEKLTGERCAGIQYEGFVKGKFEDGEFKSPYCYGYTDGGEWQTQYTNKKGWKRAPVTEYGSAEQWAKHLALTTKYDKMFQTVPPRRPESAVMEKVITQVIQNEVNYLKSLENYKRDQKNNANLEYTPSACFKFGSRYPCEFYSICFGPDDPIDSGEIPEGFEVRTSHHEED